MDWEKTKFGLLSAAGGAIVLAVIGFNWGGWLTTGSAEAMAKEIAANAVAERLGSICLAQAWAIMPGDEKADSKVADVCAKYFTEKDSVQIAR